MALLTALLMVGAPVQAAPACPAQVIVLPPELRGWNRPHAVRAGGAATGAAKLDVGIAATTTLLPAPRVTPVVTPEKPVDPARYAGILGFSVPIEGRYRVALGSAAWVEVAHDGAAIASVAHAHGPDCSGIRKMVDFDLLPGRYVLQLSDSASASTKLLIARLP